MTCLISELSLEDETDEQEKEAPEIEQENEASESEEEGETTEKEQSEGTCNMLIQLAYDCMISLIYFGKP